MPPRSIRVLTSTFVWLVALTARADVLSVGAGKTFATPCAGIAAAKPADVIEVAAGTYTDSCAITVAGLTVRGVGGRPKIDLSGTDHPAQYKGIYVIAADDVTIENLELTGAHISAANGLNAAGLRVEAKNLTVRSCYIHDNQNGILGGTSGTITVEYSEFARNAVGDGCNDGGCTHNLYIAGVDALYFRYNWSHRLATDTQDKGHLLKSRAKANYILYNRFSGEDGFDSYEIDLPNGGLAIVVGNVIQKGTKSGNGTLLAWGEEGASNPDKRVFLVNNTFVNERSSGSFLNVSGATLSLHNNIFAGAGSAPMQLGADNLAGVDPAFVDRGALDYHLSASSPARGKAVDPGKADSFALTPEYEYLHPAGKVARPKVADLGAFEFGSSPQGGAAAGSGGAPNAGRDAGAAAGSGGAGGSNAGRDAGAS
ncbi:MAG TPA: right-handed parallel beta-helix repeat-containing protein, partial [Polyangiales bacterium]|nr:right-handed parallel beta-helix repeat-containing protein [Polyangiales bacterium]